MRRTHSSLVNEIHDDPKLVADQVGHMVDVNQNVYMRASVARRKKAVRAILGSSTPARLIEFHSRTLLDARNVKSIHYVPICGDMPGPL